MVSRRNILASIPATLMVAACANSTLAARPVRRQLALCDISIRKSLAADYAGTLKEVAKMGFTHFSYRLERYRPTEAAEPPPADKAKMVADAGLKPGVVRFYDTAHLDRYLEETKLVGSEILALTLGDIFAPRADGTPITMPMVDDFAHRMEGWGARARAAGVTFAYHNHAVDAKPVDGIKPLDRMLELTNPRHVAMELDFAWTHAGGYDILDMIRRLGPRLVSMHWKDFDSRISADSVQHKTAELGAGELDLATLLPQVVALTNALPAVELENNPDEMGSVARAYAFVNSVLKGG